MVNPQLLAYVRAQRSAGVSKEEIIKALAGGGWSAADAQEAFASIDGPPTPPPAPKPVTPPVQAAPASMSAPSPALAATPAMQPRPVMTPVQTQPIQPISMKPQPAAVVQPRPAYAPALKKRAKWPWVLLFLIIFFIAGVGAGGYAAVKYDWFYSLVAGVAGEPQQEDMNMVANEGDAGGFLEVSPDPFDTGPLDEENGTSTPSASTGTSTSTATTTSGQ